MAAAPASAGRARGDGVRGWPCGGGLRPPMSPPRHKAQAVQILRYLDGIEALEETDLEATAKAFAGVSRSRGIALVISDFLAPTGWGRALDLLRHARYEVGILQVSSPEEAEAPHRGEIVLKDRESGRRMRVRVTDRIAQAYKRAFLEHGEALQSYARGHNLFYAHGRSDQPFEEMVLRTMRAERLLA